MDAEKLNSLAKIAGKDALNHGFGDSGNKYRLQVKAACEVAECVEAYKIGRIADPNRYEAALEYIRRRNLSPEESKAQMATQYIQWCKDTVQDEMADAAIFILDITYHYEIPIQQDLLENADVDEYVNSVNITKDFVEEAGRIMREIINPGMLHFEKVIVMLEKWMRDVTGQEIMYWIEKKIEYNKQRPYLHGNMSDKTL